MEGENRPHIQIEDVEEYRNETVEYSHQTLVMKAMKRVIELGGHELCEGINETSTDPKRGTTKVVYKEDTRSAFIQAIKTAEMVMICDFDDEATKNIPALYKQIEQIRDDALVAQNDFYRRLNPKQRTAMGVQVHKDFLHKSLEFYQMFKEVELDIYRLIYKELSYLTKRMGFYAAIEVIG